MFSSIGFQDHQQKWILVPRSVASLRTRLVLSALFCSLFIAVPIATASTITTTTGDVTATFNYSGTFPKFRDQRLSINRSGKIVDEIAVSSKWCGHECGPDSVPTGRSALRVANLAPNGSLAVVLTLYSGGAHCCTIEQVYTFNASSGHFKKSEYNFGDPGVELTRLGGAKNFYFLSADDRFAFAFTDFAASGLPVEILSFAHGRFHDVTRSFPKLIEHDALQWRRAFDASASSHYQDSVGLAAAWAADEDMLGHPGLVKNFLLHETAAGHLNSALNPIQSSGHKFVLALHTFLRRYGYEK